MDVNSLPDELLMYIFSFLDDGRTLLDAVPLVCHRWLRLARDPQCWAGVCLSAVKWAWWYTPEDALDQARVALHAPHLRSLTLDWALYFRVEYGYEGFEFDEPRRRLQSALHRSTASIREIHFEASSPWCRLPEGGHSVLLGLAWRNRQQLSALSFVWPPVVDEEPKLEAADSGAPPTLMGMLVHMPRLQELELRFFGDGGLEYHGELLQSDLPSLRRLILNGVLPVDMLRDVLRASERTLHSLSLFPELLTSEALQSLTESLGRCARLCKVTADLQCISVVSRMPGLVSLEVWDSEFMSEVDILSRQVDLLRSNCMILETLRHLEVLVLCSYNLNGECDELMNVLASKAPMITTLDLDLSLMYEERTVVGARMRGSLQELSDVKFDHCFPEDLQRLVPLVKLKTVTTEVYNIYEDYHEGVSVIAAAIQDFKSRRPDVEANLTWQILKFGP